MFHGESRENISNPKIGKGHIIIIIRKLVVFPLSVTWTFKRNLNIIFKVILRYFLFLRTHHDSGEI